MKHLYTIIMAGLCLAGTLSSCKKQFMPLEEGAVVPYTDTTRTLREALSALPQHSLFWAAWQRSNMDDILEAKGPSYTFNLLLPDNNAFMAAGWNLAVINRTPSAVLDSLLSYHTLEGQFDPSALIPFLGNQLFLTIQTNNAFQETYVETGTASVQRRTYRYRHYLGTEEGRLLINGQDVGAMDRAQYHHRVSLFPIDRVLVKPEKDMLQTLEADGRFSLFLDFRRHNYAHYSALGIVYAGSVLDLMSMEAMRNMVHFSSLLVPTDEAFHQVGLNSVDDLIALNNRAIPHVMEDWFTVSGYLPSDTILNNHYWQTNLLYVRSPIPGAIPAYISTNYQTNTVFYSNQLRNELLESYVTMFDGYTKVPQRINNLEFIRNGQDIKVKVKGSDYEAATIIERDIPTMNGTIHVVDRLLVPPGFEF